MFDDLPEEGSGRLVDDAYVAGLLCISRSCVRKQRLLRRRGCPHFFDIDPIMIGSLPRYRLEDVRAWISALGNLPQREKTGAAVASAQRERQR